jgi:hypothetical protein
VIDSRITPRRPNASTCLASHFRELPLDDIGLEHAYHRAKDLHAQKSVAPGTIGYRILWSFEDRFSAIDLPAAPDAYLVAGRHTHCDIVLDAEPTVALRHILMRAVVLPDGAVGVRFLDLRTSLAFHVDAGGPCRSIFAGGPIAIRLGPYAIVALPLDPNCVPASLPKPTLARQLAMPRAVAVSPYRAPAPRGGDGNGRAFRSSHITILPSIPALEELPPTKSGFARITVERGRCMASVEVGDAALESGILIGRADKCMDQGLRALLDETISRAHVLIIREEGRTSAFDLCSVHGTYARGVRVRHYPLADSGTSLALGHGQALRLNWQACVLK